MHVWAIFLGVVLAILFLVFIFWFFKKPSHGHAGGPLHQMGNMMTGGGRNNQMGAGKNSAAASVGKNAAMLADITTEIEGYYTNVGMNQSAAASESAVAEADAFYEGLNAHAEEGGDGMYDDYDEEY